MGGSASGASGGGGECVHVSASAVGCAAQGVAVVSSAVSRAAQRMAMRAIAVGGKVVAVCARRKIIVIRNSRIGNWIPSCI